MKHEIINRGPIVDGWQNSILRLTPDEEELQMIRDADYPESHDFEVELFDHLTSNSELQWLSPALLGDLTDAPMLGILDEDEKVLGRWAFMSYAVRAMTQDMLDDGFVLLQGGNTPDDIATKSVQFQTFSTPEGKPTCARDMQIGEYCRFLMLQGRDKAPICGMKSIEWKGVVWMSALQRDESGHLIPCRECILHT